MVILIPIMLDGDLKGLPGRDTIAMYKEGKYEILKGDKETTFDIYDHSSDSSLPIIKNVKKWKLVTVRFRQYICAMDENNHFYILNLDNGNLQGPLLLKDIPKEFVRYCKSMM
jgi:hypothetical protein